MRTEYLPFGKPNFADEEIAAVSQVLRSGWVGMGPETLAFENELAEFLNVPHVITVNSCTSALFLSLLALGIGPDDEVICPSLTWCATANAALYLGARPVFCDVDPDTLGVTPEYVKEKLTDKTKAVILVHYGGLAVEVEPIRAILPDTVAIVEDAAHALGARFIDGQAVGASGNLTCFSFYANKNLSTGEGGAITLFDEDMANHLRSLRQNGLPVNAWNRFTQPKAMIYSSLSELGYKMNFTDLQATIGRIQLKRQPEFQSIRQGIAQYYCETLRDLEPPVRFQCKVTDAGHARHLFVIQLPIEAIVLSRDEFLLSLRTRNVGASIHYSPLHQMQLYYDHEPPNLPNTEYAFKCILTLPISASMTLEDADYVTGQVKELLLKSVD